jgi:uncharacterized membrane protein
VKCSIASSLSEYGGRGTALSTRRSLPTLGLSFLSVADDPTYHEEMKRDLHAEEAGAAWGWPSKGEPRWPAQLAIAVTIGLELVLPAKLLNHLGPRWLIPALAGALGLALLIISPRRITRESKELRVAAIVLIGLINIANVVSLGELIQALLYKTSSLGGRPLIIASVPIWLTNVIVFSLWYWELDRGGPARRLRPDHRRPDFLFPQMSTPGCADPGWTPCFFDYLYTSFTNATAFSPTDTMPLTLWAKLLMALQSTASLLTVALVVSRAVNILA